VAARLAVQAVAVGLLVMGIGLAIDALRGA